ncbi:hypothetical protein BKA69DRAFT_869782 [Paraphysoderma sedebokerense]|nr:hypothetical protein BKA69DRAFT_869782 [Paraphysoderma sedebokerense]
MRALMEHHILLRSLSGVSNNYFIMKWPISAPRLRAALLTSKQNKMEDIVPSVIDIVLRFLRKTSLYKQAFFSHPPIKTYSCGYPLLYFLSAELPIEMKGLKNLVSPSLSRNAKNEAANVKETKDTKVANREPNVIRAAYSYEAKDPYQVSFGRGEKFIVLDSKRGWWFVAVSLLIVCCCI